MTALVYNMGIVHCFLPFVKCWQVYLQNASIASSNKNPYLKISVLIVFGAFDTGQI